MHSGSMSGGMAREVSEGDPEVTRSKAEEDAEDKNEKTVVNQCQEFLEVPAR